MPGSFVVFIAALIGLAISAGTASKAESPKTKSFANGAAGLFIVIMTVAVLVALWSAWAPWDISLESK